MVKSVENGTSLPPFLVKCYEMVNDESTNELISWSESNDSFIIWDESRFSSELLPKYFKHSNFSSFVRQLNIYGFRKIDTDHWQFANEAFIKGQKHLLKNISRRKQPQNPVQKKSPQHKDTEPTQQSEEDKAIALWKEVEILKTHKNALTQELKKLHQHQQTSKSKMLLVREQLKGMEKNQQQMLSFIVMAMQSPEFMVQFFQPKDNSWRVAETGKTKLSEVTDDCEPTPSDGVIVRYEPPKDGYPVPASTTEASKSDDLMELDFSSDEIRDLFMDIDLLLGPIDEKLLPLENRGQFVLPDTPENDTMLEQLLLSYPSTENEQHAECEADKSDDSTDDFDEYQNHITEDTNFQSPIDTSEKVQVLTERMGFITSEI
ncbi:hypothetical protein DH2020_020580 [Rehmannia glutinosa]|uniref:HSF-type DNA-binding domain-containing protein n=1 Tax=Rehmannia glutinosa TaxID=99300 RepID=A0ABR0WIL3_REHGL